MDACAPSIASDQVENQLVPLHGPGVLVAHGLVSTAVKEAVLEACKAVASKVSSAMKAYQQQPCP